MNEAEGSRPAYSTARSASYRPTPVYSVPVRRFQPSRAAQSGLRAPHAGKAEQENLLAPSASRWSADGHSAKAVKGLAVRLLPG